MVLFPDDPVLPNPYINTGSAPGVREALPESYTRQLQARYTRQLAPWIASVCHGPVLLRCAPSGLHNYANGLLTC
jgi:putative intracellular protease/amidase